MTSKIDELTEKIYREGIEKAKEDAAQIIEEAKKRASQIIQSAKEEKKEIVDSAAKEAEEIRKKVNSEIILAARQFTSNLKQKITNLITTAQIGDPVKSSFQDIEFIKKIILTTVQNWNPQNTEDTDIKLLLPEKDEKEFRNFLKSKAILAMENGIEVKMDPKTKNGFKIGPGKGNYIISFTDKDFENFFKEHFKESTRKLLFQEDQKE